MRRKIGALIALLALLLGFGAGLAPAASAHSLPGQYNSSTYWTAYTVGGENASARIVLYDHKLAVVQASYYASSPASTLRVRIEGPGGGQQFDSTYSLIYYGIPSGSFNDNRPITNYIPDCSVVKIWLTTSQGTVNSGWHRFVYGC